MIIDLKTAANRLKNADNIYILMHNFPDGDTLGSGYALMFALRALGKRAKTLCADAVPECYDYFAAMNNTDDFSPDFIVAVDVADTKLLGKLDCYADKIDLCIDHHKSNTDYAKETYVDGEAAAACEIIYELISLLDVEIDKNIAAALYTGIATDTGCFKFTNTTAKTHIIAAALINCGIDYGEINRIMFDTKTKSRVAVEQMAMSSIEFSHDDKIALMSLTQAMITSSGADDSQLEGITSLPRTIEGVVVGITVRERRDGKYKISLRTHAPVSASMICARFGGGGHDRAAGCELAGDIDDVKRRLLAAADEALRAQGL